MWIHANITVSLNTDTWERKYNRVRWTTSPTTYGTEEDRMRICLILILGCYFTACLFDYQSGIFQLILPTFNLADWSDFFFCISTMHRSEIRRRQVGVAGWTEELFQPVAYFLSTDRVLPGKKEPPFSPSAGLSLLLCSGCAWQQAY